jgi:hypothetical protein
MNFTLTPIAAPVMQKMTSERLHNHIKSYRAYEANFRCGCCHQYWWDMNPDSHADGAMQKEYKTLKKYLQSAWDIINKRGDQNLLRTVAFEKEQQRINRSNNRGHQKISHSQRKKDRIRKKFD